MNDEAQGVLPHVISLGSELAVLHIVFVTNGVDVQALWLEDPEALGEHIGYLVIGEPHGEEHVRIDSVNESSEKGR